MHNDEKQIDSLEIISTLFPDSVTGIILPIDDYLSQLTPAEYKIIDSACDKRKLEFSTGRWCAKQALAIEGINNLSILSGKNREPIWPTGIVGSISHCKDECGAVIAKSNNIGAIGFDVENIKELKNDIAKIVCTKIETKWLAEQNKYPYNVMLLLIFSLKESVYKCIFQHQQLAIEFKDCSIIPSFDLGSANIKFHQENIHLNISLNFKISSDHIYSSAICFS